MTFDDNKWKVVGAPDDNFAAVLSGFLNVQNAGEYEFWTKSDDGSELWIDKARVVDNSGLHAPETKKGTVSLSKGLHSILVPFVECRNGAYLKISWKGPDTGGKEQPVDLQGIWDDPGVDDDDEDEGGNHEWGDGQGKGEEEDMEKLPTWYKTGVRSKSD